MLWKYLTVKRKKWSYFIQRHKTMFLSGYTSFIFYSTTFHNSGINTLSIENIFKMISKSFFPFFSEKQDLVSKTRGQQYQRNERRRSVHSEIYILIIKVHEGTSLSNFLQDSNPPWLSGVFVLRT